jgi:hypothetical protein
MHLPGRKTLSVDLRQFNHAEIVKSSRGKIQGNYRRFVVKRDWSGFLLHPRKGELKYDNGTLHASEAV